MLKSGHTSQILVSMAAAAMMMLFAAPAVAFATGDYIGKTKKEITASLEKHGYKIEEIEKEGGYLEAEVSHDGKMFEVQTDPASGKVVEIVEGDEEDGVISSVLKKIMGTDSAQ